MKYIKILASVICLLVMGFFAFTLFTGFGVLIGFIVSIFPTWQIVIGTLVASVGVFLHLIGEKK
jgi:hypothetical protein